jgi:hypothetical protein
MRFRVKENRPGDTRTKRGFLWFPKWIGEEIRWLERAGWKQIYLPTGHWGALEWSDLAWTDGDTRTEKDANAYHEI